MKKYYMENVDTFKAYMTDVFKPGYLRDYVNSLDEKKLYWFYLQMKEPLEFLTYEGYLIYKLKWILQRNFDDLSYEIYVEYILNPEGFKHEIIKWQWEEILDYRYYEQTNFF